MSETASTTATKSHVTAGLLALFLGGLGIHKFYLGYTKEGVILLVINLVGVILNTVAGIGLGYYLSLAVDIFCLIEAIQYFRTKNPEFQEKYVQGSHPWL